MDHSEADPDDHLSLADWDHLAIEHIEAPDLVHLRDSRDVAAAAVMAATVTASTALAAVPPPPWSLGGDDLGAFYAAHGILHGRKDTLDEALAKPAWDWQGASDAHETAGLLSDGMQLAAADESLCGHGNGIRSQASAAMRPRRVEVLEVLSRALFPHLPFFSSLPGNRTAAGREDETFPLFGPKLNSFLPSLQLIGASLDPCITLPPELAAAETGRTSQARSWPRRWR